MTTQTAQFLIVLVGIVMAGAGMIVLLLTFGHIGKTYDVVIDRDKTGIWSAIILTLIGLILIGVALFLPVMSARAEGGPPPGWVRATVSTCAPYNPSSCQSRTVWLENRAWCGKRANWWSPSTGREAVTVRCGQ